MTDTDMPIHSSPDTPGTALPAVSIIVPVYRTEPYLERCMQSLLGQTMSDLEVILVDDGSPDGCPKMCDDYARRDSRVRVIHKDNAGLGFARNSGLDTAQGEYVSIVDSDDYAERNMLEILLARATVTGADAVYGGIFYDRPDGIVTAPGPSEPVVWQGRSAVDELLLDQVATRPGRTGDTVMEVSVWRALFRRDILDRNGIRFVSERQFISEDIIFNIDLLQKCSCVAAVPDPVYHYCTNPESLSKVFRPDRFQKVKELYHEICRRLALLFPEETWRLRTGRFLIARARRNAISVVRQRNSAGRAQERQWLTEICRDPDLTEVLSAYPIHKLPLQQFTAAFLMRMRWYPLLEKLLALKH